MNEEQEAEKSYVEKLENTIVFLCATYVAIQDVVREHALCECDIWDKVPRIQGSRSLTAIDNMAEMEKRVSLKTSYFAEIEAKIAARLEAEGK